MANQQQHNQKLQNTANQLSQELKPNNRQTTAAAETSSEIKENVIGGSSAGGVAGSGGVSTNDVGGTRTSKNPLMER